MCFVVGADFTGIFKSSIESIMSVAIDTKN